MDEPADEGETWLLSYADMMTLIACFFILMMAFANFDPVGFSQKTKIISQSFSKGKVKVTNQKFKDIREEVAKHPELLKMTKLTLKDTKMIIAMSGSVLFPKNGYELTEKMNFLLDSLIDIIKTKGEDNYKIIIEGHSDNLPLPSKALMRSHWLLAGARAASVAERFEYFGFDPKNFKIVSFGDSRPLKPNQDENGKPILKNTKLNRRVVIQVLEKQVFKKGEKLGFGVLFKD